MPWVGFEPIISAGERPKTYTLDRAATGTGWIMSIFTVNIVIERHNGLHCRLFTQNKSKPNHVTHGGHLMGLSINMLLTKTLSLGIIDKMCVCLEVHCIFVVRYHRAWFTMSSVSQPLWDRGPVNYFFIRRGPRPNKFTRKYLSNFFLSSCVKLT